MNNVVKEYDKLNHRNNKKTNEELNKHAMHLVRLLKMGTEILEGKGIITYRENDRDALLEIRNGKYQKEDGSFYEDFFESIDELEIKFKYAANNSNLLPKPDFKKVEELVMEIYKNRF